VAPPSVYDYSSVTNPQLANIQGQVDANSDRAIRLLQGLTAEQILCRPEPNTWSIGECIAHLTLTTGEYLPLADAALRNAPPGGGPLTKDWMGALLAWSLEPPYRMKSKTLPAFVPRNVEPGRIQQQFLDSQAQFKERLRAANGCLLDRTTIQSPFNRHLKYNLYSLFHILTAHQRRHLWQAENVRVRLSSASLKSC
jgi:DinB superfamily